MTKREVLLFLYIFIINYKKRYKRDLLQNFVYFIKRKLRYSESFDSFISCLVFDTTSLPYYEYKMYIDFKDFLYEVSKYVF